MASEIEKRNTAIIILAVLLVLAIVAIIVVIVTKPKTTTDCSGCSSSGSNVNCTSSSCSANCPTSNNCSKCCDSTTSFNGTLCTWNQDCSSCKGTNVTCGTSLNSCDFITPTLVNATYDSLSNTCNGSCPTPPVSTLPNSIVFLISDTTQAPNNLSSTTAISNVLPAVQNIYSTSAVATIGDLEAITNYIYENPSVCGNFMSIGSLNDNSGTQNIYVGYPINCSSFPSSYPTGPNVWQNQQSNQVWLQIVTTDSWDTAYSNLVTNLDPLKFFVNKTAIFVSNHPKVTAS